MRLIDADELKKKLKLWIFNKVTITEFDIDECLTIYNIPNNVTNGDIIKTLFPNREFINKGDVYWYPLDYLFHEFSPSWWDSPYDPNKTEEEEA